MLINSSKSFFFVFLIVFFSSKNAYSAYYRCNSNNECKAGYYCIDGIASTPAASGYTGDCVPNIVLRQLCYFYAITSGKVGRIIVIFGVLSFGISMLTSAKIDPKSIFTTVIGSLFIVAGLNIIGFFIGDSSQVCQL